MFQFVKRKVKKAPLLYTFLVITIFFHLMYILPVAYNNSLDSSNGILNLSKFHLRVIDLSLVSFGEILSLSFSYIILNNLLYDKKVAFKKNILIAFSVIVLTFITRHFIVWLLNITCNFSLFYNNNLSIEGYTVWWFSYGFINESIGLVSISKDILLFTFLCSILNKQQVILLSQKFISQLTNSKSIIQQDSGFNEPEENIASRDNLKNNEDLITVLLVGKGNEKKFIRVEDILYFVSDGNYIDIFMIDNDYTIRMTLKDLELKLPDYFFRVHRSNIINLNKVASLKQNSNLNIYKAKMLNQKEIPCSRKYQKIIKEKLTKIKRQE